jgi:UDP-N-acetylglucosamine 2-epimerase (non-hydrolysing)
VTAGRRLKVMSIVGTRPNFMKIAPIAAALARRADVFDHQLVHTGQHYDDDMSRVFLDQLDVGEPDHLLGVGAGSHAQQAARVMERLEPILEGAGPDVVLVPGDVNSTLAAALVAAKLGIAVGHVEAGLRSFDRSMPEEINRVVADSVSDLLFIHSPEARDNLLAEGARPDSIHHVGNTMIDTLIRMAPAIESAGAPARFGVEPNRYVVATLHRPALVDGDLLERAMDGLAHVGGELPVVFPVHPRTSRALASRGIAVDPHRVRLLEPLGLVDFLSLVRGAASVLTDSGGVQEETTFLGVPCFTLRDNTERPITVEAGTNRLLGLAPERIPEIPALTAQARERAPLPPIPLWDGRAAERIADVLHAEVRP